MLGAGRVLMMAEMHGRDLLRRPAALLLLVALPMAFYLSAGDAFTAAGAGGVGMAFAVAGATLFSTISSAEVDRRLVLGGYRPVELVLGRLLFLGPLGLLMASAFWALLMVLADPAQPWLVWLGIGAVALQSVPFGLAVGAAVGRELEGTLVVIGVVGVQMAADPDSAVATVLPFHHPQALIVAGMRGSGAVVGHLLWSAAYGLALLALARLFLVPRLDVAADRARGEQRASS